MAIRGLTDQGASFPEIGRLRKGEEKPSGNRPGKDLTYFRFDTEDDLAAKMFSDAYGKEANDINVFLPFDTVDENFMTAKEAWKAGGLQHRCDGETCEIWLKDDGTYSRDPIPCPGDCKEVGRLKVIIPELKRLAYVTVLTHSIHDIITLHQTLSGFQLIGRSLRGVPFVLRRRPRQISTPAGKGKRVRREKWLLMIEPLPVWANATLTAMEANALPKPDDSEVLMLDAPETEAVTEVAFDPEPEQPPAPEQPPKPEPAQPAQSNGNGKKMLTVSELADRALGKVNAQTDGYYDNIHHLKGAWEKMSGSARWPAAKDTEAWVELIGLLTNYAHEQRQAESEPEAETAEADLEAHFGEVDAEAREAAFAK